MFRATLLLVAACALSITACFTTEQADLHDRALRARTATPKCDGGDASACADACEAGGSNKSCTRACDANVASACAQLANRLENGVDFDDAEAASKHIEQGDPEVITGLYEKACKGGFGGACQMAGGRMLNGVGRGKRDGGTAVDLLKLGCQKWRAPESCCSMAQLNLKLAEGSNVNTITDFREEARKWSKLSERFGKECPDKLVDSPPATNASAPIAP